MPKIEYNCFDTKPRVMAIVNVTPDSFYADSRTMDETAIASRVEQVVCQGADMVDLGGYSTRPGAQDVAMDEELERLDRAFDVVKRIAPDILISVDTFRSEVVERLYDKWGDFVVNDVTAGEADSEMITTVGRLRLPYIAMHSRGTPQTMQSMNQYDDVTHTVSEFFRAKIRECQSAGIEDLTLDPGFGFAKNLSQNFELLANLRPLCQLGRPLLVGLSRKSMIWRTLDVTPQDALGGTIALNWEALRQGAKILRVHDVTEAVQTVRLFEAFEHGG